MSRKRALVAQKVGNVARGYNNDLGFTDVLLCVRRPGDRVCCQSHRYLRFLLSFYFPPSARQSMSQLLWGRE